MPQVKEKEKMEDSKVLEIAAHLLASDEYHEVPDSAKGIMELQGAIRLVAGEVAGRDNVSYRDGFNREYGKVFTQTLYSAVHAWEEELVC